MARPRKEQELDIAGRAIDETIRLVSVRGRGVISAPSSV